MVDDTLVDRRDTADELCACFAAAVKYHQVLDDAAGADLLEQAGVFGVVQSQTDNAVALAVESALEGLVLGADAQRPLGIGR